MKERGPTTKRAPGVKPPDGKALPFDPPFFHSSTRIACRGGRQGGAAGTDGYFAEEPVAEIRGTWSNCAVRLVVPADWLDARAGASGPRLTVYALGDMSQTPLFSGLVSALALTSDSRGEFFRGELWVGGEPSTGFRVTVATDDEDGRDGLATAELVVWGDQSTPNSKGENGASSVTPVAAPARNSFSLFFDETAGRWVPGLRGPGGGIIVEPSRLGGPWSNVHSTALEASHLIANGPATFRGATVRLDSTAPGGTYYVQVYNANALPANGPVNFLVAPVKVQHVNGIDDLVELDEPDGLPASVGIVIGLSSTEFTKTLSGAFLSIDALKA